MPKKIQKRTDGKPWTVLMEVDSNLADYADKALAMHALVIGKNTSLKQFCQDVVSQMLRRYAEEYDNLMERIKGLKEEGPRL